MTTQPETTRPVPLDGQGRQLASDGLPLLAHDRARALAAAGLVADALALVPDSMIAAYRPVPIAAVPQDGAVEPAIDVKSPRRRGQEV